VWKIIVQLIKDNAASEEFCEGCLMGWMVINQTVFDVFTILAIVSPALLFMTMSASSSHGVSSMFMITSLAPASFAYTGIKAAMSPAGKE
jgi:hypothetical protein